MPARRPRPAALLVTGALVLAVALTTVVATSTGTLGGPGQIGRQNIRGIRIDASTDLPALQVRQRGQGLAADFQGPVRIDGPLTGAISVTNDLDGTRLVLDADGDTSLASEVDDHVHLASGTSAGLWSVLVGSLKVGNATPNRTLDGEDAYVEGSLEVDGPTRLDGGLDMQEQAIVNVGSLSLVDDLDAQGRLLLDIGSPGTDFRPGGGLTLANGLTITAGGQHVSGLVRLAAPTPLAVTDGATFAPTSSLQPITAAAPATPVLAIPPAGTVLCLYNAGTTPIVLADTTNQVLAGTWTAGPYDILCGYSDGTRFIETSRSDN